MQRVYAFILFCLIFISDANSQPMGMQQSEMMSYEGAVVAPNAKDYERPEAEESKAMEALNRARGRLSKGEFPSSLSEEERHRRESPEYRDERFAPEQESQEPYRQIDDPKYTQDILYWFPFVEIQTDGNVIITETISLNERTSYKNGFERNFPLTYRNTQGDVVQTSLNVLSASLNENEILHEANIKDGNYVLNLKYSPEYFTEQVNTIKVTYRLSNAITLNDKGETELFIELVGKGWDKRVLNLGLAVIFVNGTEVLENVAFLTKNPKQSSFKVATDAEKNIGFVADKPLSAGEGVSLYLKWKSDVINGTETHFSIDSLLEKHGVLIAFVGSLFLLLIYYALLPFSVKKDKDFFAKRINSLRNLSASALRYVLRKRFDGKVNSTIILDMLAKSGAKLQEFEDKYEVSASSKKPKKLSKLNKFLYNSLFSKKKKLFALTVEKSKLKKIFLNLHFFDVLEAEMFFIKQNVKFILVGFFVALFALIGGAFMSLDMLYVLMFGGLAIIFAFIGLFAAYICVKTFKRLKAAVISSWLCFVGVGAVSLLISGFGIYKIILALGIVNGLILSLIPVVVLVMHIMFKASASTARYIHDSFTAFKKSLSTSAPAVNEKVLWANFDKFLPYAMALDIEAEYDARYFGEGQTIGETALSYVPQKFKSGSKITSDLSAEIEKILN